jgi:hypothetical protein
MQFPFDVGPGQPPALLHESTVHPGVRSVRDAVMLLMIGQMSAIVAPNTH